jgi:hypothetical protein
MTDEDPRADLQAACDDAIAATLRPLEPGVITDKQAAELRKVARAAKRLEPLEPLPLDLDEWRADAEALERPQPGVRMPDGYTAARRMLALIAEVERLRRA